MTHSYDDRGALPPRSRADRMLALGVGVTLAVTGTLSLVHLIDQYGKAAPYREARAAERDREREARAQRAAEREAADALRDAGGVLPPPVAVQPGSDVVPEGAFRLEDLPSAQRREVERLLEREGARSPVPVQTERPIVSRPLRWYIPPSWPSVRNDAFPEGVSRMRVQFRCRVTRDGSLADCTSTEQPVGTGLAARMRPALDRARVEPSMVNGRPVESRISFGVSFSAAPRRLVAPPPPPAEAEKPPAYIPASPLPSADRLDAPAAPEPPEQTPAD